MARWGPLEVATVLLLTLGPLLLPILGTIIGIGCAWTSTQWTRQEKIASALWAVLMPLLLLTALWAALLARSAG